VLCNLCFLISRSASQKIVVSVNPAGSLTGTRCNTDGFVLRLGEEGYWRGVCCP
jgi:hypothetical protein